MHESEEARGPRLMTTGLALTGMVAFGCLYYSFGALLPHVADDLDLPPEQVSVAFSAALVASSVTTALLGRVLDRVGSRGPLVLGTVLGAIGLLMWARVDSLVTLTLVWLFLGLVGPMVFYEPAFHAVVRRRGRQRIPVLLITLVGGLASTVFVPLFGTAAGSFGWRVAALAGALAMLGINLPLQLAMWRGLRLPARPLTAAPTRVRQPAGLRPLLLITVAMAAPGLVSGALAAHLVVLMLAFGHPPAFSYLAAGLIGAGSVTGRVLLGGLLRWVRTIPHVLVPLFLVQAGAMAALGIWGTSRAVALCCIVVIGTGTGLASVTRPLLTADYLGSARFGTTSGTSSAINMGMRAAGPAFMGVVAAGAGGYAAALLVLAAPLLLTVAALLRLGRLPAPVGLDDEADAAATAGADCQRSKRGV